MGAAIGFLCGALIMAIVCADIFFAQQLRDKNEDLQKEMKNLAQLVKETVTIHGDALEDCTDKNPDGKEATIVSVEKAIELVQLADKSLERPNQEQEKGKKKE